MVVLGGEQHPWIDGPLKAQGVVLRKLTVGGARAAGLIGGAGAVVPVAGQAVVADQPLPVVMEAPGILHVPALAGNVEVEGRVVEVLEAGVSPGVLAGQAPPLFVVLERQHPGLEVEVAVAQSGYRRVEPGVGIGCTDGRDNTATVMLIANLADSRALRVE